MRWNRVATSTLTNSASQALRLSSALRSSDLELSTCILQYSITIARIPLVTFGRGMAPSEKPSSIMCLIVCNSNATMSSTSNVTPSELIKFTFLDAISLSHTHSHSANEKSKNQNPNPNRVALNRAEIGVREIAKRKKFQKNDQSWLP